MTKLRHLIVFAALLGACAKKADKAGVYRQGPAKNEATKTSADKAEKDGKGDEDRGGEQTGMATKQTEDNRKIIRTGRIDLVVATYDDARAKIDKLVEQVGGYVDSTQVNRRQDAISDATIVIRIPSTGFGTLLPKLREIGEIVSESTNASDITDQYVDISARLASAQTLEKRLLELATEKKGNIEQILAVERELARVRTEVEGYEGKLRQWNDQVAMSTLTLALSTKRPEIAATDPGLGTRIKQTFHDSVDSLRAFGSWLIVTLIALAPWLLVLIPAFVFGRKLARRYIKLPMARARDAQPPMPPAPPAA
jgi:hypothetical protein